MSIRESESGRLIDLRAWQQFLMLAELLHFGKAAAQLGMTQPPLTQAIQKLESRLGTPLFERTRRSVKLTPAGLALVEPVHHLLNTVAGLPQLARNAAEGRSGTLRLGFVSTVGFGPLPTWLRGFREQRSEVTVHLNEATYNVQLAAFAEGKLDAGFMLHAPGPFLPKANSLNCLSLGLEPLVLALPDTITPSVRSLTTAALLAQPLVIFPRESAPSLYDSILAFYHRQGKSPTIAQQAIQMQTIVNLVSAGLGVALVPKAIARLRRTGVIYRRLPRPLAAVAPRCETSLVWTKDAGPVVLEFVQYVRKHLVGRGRDPR